MHHLAVLSKKRDLLSKIVSGEKTIESRWYKFKRTPYNSIKKGDVVYFEESGGPVKVRCNVDKVLFFSDLNGNKVRWILSNYGKKICIPISYASKLKDKNYCTLIFLENTKEISPFHINKKGYGLMNAWITVKDINELKEI